MFRFRISIISEHFQITFPACLWCCRGVWILYVYRNVQGGTTTLREYKFMFDNFNYNN